MIDEELLQAAGITETNQARAEFFTQKILNDHLVLERGMKLAAQAFAVQVVHGLTDLELTHLRKRIAPTPISNPQQVAPAVVGFSVAQGARDGHWFILATCDKSAPGSHESKVEILRYAGDPKRAAEFFAFGQHPPAHVIEHYAKVADWQPAPVTRTQGAPGLNSFDAFPDFDPNAADARRRAK